MTCMRAWMSLKFGQIRLLVSMATDRVFMGKTLLPLFLGCYQIPFVLAGNDDMHESLEDRFRYTYRNVTTSFRYISRTGTQP